MKPKTPRKKSDPAQAKPDRVATALEREIRSGKLRFGARLQSENELGRRFAVSRATVRKGLEALVGKGLIKTKIGIGSFVTFDGEALDSAMGWTRALSLRRHDIETHVLRIEIVRDPDLARSLKQGIARFIAIDRLRVLKGETRAISVERSRVPCFPELEQAPIRGLTGGSLQETLRSAGLIADSGEEWAAVEFLSSADAEAMGVAVGSPALKTTRVVRDVQGRVIEHVVSLLDPKHFALHLEF